MPRASIDIRVQPGADRSAIVGRYGQGLKIKIAAAPDRGKANSALVDFLAERLKVNQDDIVVVRGLTSRNKCVVVEGIEEAQAWQLLLGEGP